MAVLILGTVAQAQWEAPLYVDFDHLFPSTQAMPSSPPPGITPKVSILERYSEARRGRDQEVMVVFCARRNKDESCPLSFQRQEYDLVPLLEHLDSEDGFEVRYRNATTPYEAFSTYIGVANPIYLKVRVHRNARLGLHTLIARITYLYYRDDRDYRDYKGGKQPPRKQIDVTIPLTVVPHDARVDDRRWAFRQTPKWKGRIKIALLAPIATPAILLWLAGCAITNCDL